MSLLLGPRRALLTRPRPIAATPPIDRLAATYRGHHEDETDASSYVVAGADLGPPSPDRVVVLGLIGGSVDSSGILVSDVKVAGVAASPVVNGSSSRVLALWTAAAPTGERGDIVVTTSSRANRMAIDWWTITGTSQGGYAARNADKPEVVGSGASITSTPVFVPSGGVGICLVRVSAAAPTSPRIVQTTGAPDVRRSARVTTSSLFDVAVDTVVEGPQAWTYSHQSGAVNLMIASIAWAP